MDMDDEWTEQDEAELTPEYREERSRAVQRAQAVFFTLHLAPKGSIWDQKFWRRPEWRSGVLH